LYVKARDETSFWCTFTKKKMRNERHKEKEKNRFMIGKNEKKAII
jgi:hypothetical protein